jgi:hypothetical protein
MCFAAKFLLRLIVFAAIAVAGSFPANATVTRPTLVPVERIAAITSARLPGTVTDNSGRPRDPLSATEIDFLDVDDDCEDDEGLISSAFLVANDCRLTLAVLSFRSFASAQPLSTRSAENALHLRC